MEDFELLVALLARIWSPQNKHKWVVQGGIFTFQAPLTDSIYFLWSDEVASILGRVQVVTVLTLLSQSPTSAGTPLALSCYRRSGELFAKTLVHDHYEETGLSSEGIHHGNGLTISKELRQYIDQWLPLFRRNCFLSGCPLECTAHEQLEWRLWLEEQGSGIDSQDG